MATIVFQRMSQLVTDYVMGNSGTITPPAGGWYAALACTVVGSGANMARGSIFSATVSGSNINEIGSTAPAGYARVAVARSLGAGGTDWASPTTFDSTFSTGGQSVTSDQVTFGPFSGAPNPGSTGSPASTNSWVLTETSTINNSSGAYPYFAADTAAPRVFANGDTEKVTMTLKAG